MNTRLTKPWAYYERQLDSDDGLDRDELPWALAAARNRMSASATASGT